MCRSRVFLPAPTNPTRIFWSATARMVTPNAVLTLERPSRDEWPGRYELKYDTADGSVFERRLCGAIYSWGRYRRGRRGPLRRQTDGLRPGDQERCGDRRIRPAPVPG